MDTRATRRPGRRARGEGRTPRVPRTPWRDRTRKERGIALVWMALTLILMVLFAGFAVDVSNWWLRAERIQRAADSGAHAGVVFLPGDLTSATTTARAETAKNGYPNSGTTTVAVSQEPNPNRLRVKVTTDVPSYFLGLIGIDKIRMQREAVAEYVAPVPMGSPQNKLGNDPDNVDPGTQLWVNVSGPQTGKQQGDRYQSKVCDGSPREFACTGSSSSEYATDGYFFAMEVKNAVSGQPLNFQVYDAAWVNVGFTCNTNMPTSQQINGGGGFTALTTKFADAATRFGGTQPTKYCAGDGHAGTNRVDTTFIFREPDDTPWSNLDNPVINTSTCKPVTIPGYNPATASTPSRYIYDLLMSPTTGKVDPNDGVVTFAETFQRFTSLCSVPAGSVQTGKYVVQVRTNVKAAAPLTYDPTVSTAGHTRN